MVSNYHSSVFWNLFLLFFWMHGDYCKQKTWLELTPILCLWAPGSQQGWPLVWHGQLDTLHADAPQVDGMVGTPRDLTHLLHFYLAQCCPSLCLSLVLHSFPTHSYKSVVKYLYCGNFMTVTALICVGIGWFVLFREEVPMFPTFHVSEVSLKEKSQFSSMPSSGDVSGKRTMHWPAPMWLPGLCHSLVAPQQTG